MILVRLEKQINYLLGRKRKQGHNFWKKGNRQPCSTPTTWMQNWRRFPTGKIRDVQKKEIDEQLQQKRIKLSMKERGSLINY